MYPVLFHQAWASLACWSCSWDLLHPFFYYRFFCISLSYCLCLKLALNTIQKKVLETTITCHHLLCHQDYDLSSNSTKFKFMDPFRMLTHVQLSHYSDRPGGQAEPFQDGSQSRERLWHWSWRHFDFFKTINSPSFPLEFCHHHSFLELSSCYYSASIWRVL